MNDRSFPLVFYLNFLSCFVGKKKIKWNEHAMVERERFDECLSLGPTNGASFKRSQRRHEHMRAAAGARRWGQRQELGKREREREKEEREGRGGLQERGMTPPLLSLGSSHVKSSGDSFFGFFKGR